MERKVGSKAIWTIATLAVVLIALTTWLVMPVMSVVIAVDKKVNGETYRAHYLLQGQSWEVDTYWVYEISSDIGRAYYFSPVRTIITVAYVALLVPFWPLGYMAYQRKLRARPRNFIAYLISTSFAVALGLWIYGLIPIQLYTR